MVCPGREQFFGTVKADKVYMGGKANGVCGSSRRGLGAIAVEEGASVMGRVRLNQVPNALPASVEAFRAEAVESGRVIRPDRWRRWARLLHMGHRYDEVAKGWGPGRTDREFPRVLRVPPYSRGGWWELIRAV